MSLARLLDPDAALKATAGSDLSFLCSRPLGGTDVLDGLWRRLGIDTAMSRLLAKRRGSSPFERVLFELVANRALVPSSKLAAVDWINHDVHIDGLPEVTDDVCYRAMDWLHDVAEHSEREVFHQVADLLNLEVDLLFFDPTSTYFELEDPDEPLARDDHGHALPDNSTAQNDGSSDSDANRAGFRTYGKSKRVARRAAPPRDPCPGSVARRGRGSARRLRHHPRGALRRDPPADRPDRVHHRPGASG